VGNNPAEIQRQIEAKRAQIGARIEGVQHRVRGDATDLKQSAEDQASATLEQAKSKLNLSAQAQEHPLSMLTGALGLGVILGAASEGMPGRSDGRHDSGQASTSRSSSNNSGDGMLGGLMMSAIGPAAETVRDELRDLIKEGFSAFKENSGLKQDGHSADSTAGAPESRSYTGA
jgi:hypothetical protein